MPTLDVTLTHPNATTDTVSGVMLEDDNEFYKKWTASVYVEREVINNASFTLFEGRTEVEVADSGTSLFGGVLRQVSRGNSLIELVCDSYEFKAQKGEPSAPGKEYQQNSVDTIWQDAIDDVPDLTAGTLGPTDTVEFVFSTTSPAKRIRESAEKVDAEVSYNPDKTVDVVSSLGSDKTGTTISPANQNIADEFVPRQKGGDERVTHLLLLGDGSGPEQTEATVVPSDDTRDFENEAKFKNVYRYTANNWSDGDPREWSTAANNNMTDADTLGNYGKQIAKEANEEHTEVQVTVEGPDVALGDEFTVDNPSEDISNKVLRAVRVQRVVDNEGYSYKTVFSNRKLSREDKSADTIRDVDRHNVDFEGDNVNISRGGGRQPVGPDTNYSFSFYYPDEITYRHRVKLFVKGDAYRAYSKGSAASASVIENEVPLDTITSEGFTGKTIERMRYPGVGEADQTVDPVIYNEGTNADRWDSFTQGIGTTSFGDPSTTLNAYAELTDGGGQPFADAHWGQLDSINVNNYTEVEIDWEASLTHPDDPANVGVAITLGGSSGDSYLIYDDRLQFTGSDRSNGFSRTTDTLSINNAEGRESLRAHAWSAANTGTGTAEVDVYRLEFK